MPHGITQCYMPPGRDDIPALTPAEAGTRLSDPGVMQGCVDLVNDLVMSECSLSRRGQGHVNNFYTVDLENFATASRR